jgi:hypothetical protein
VATDEGQREDQPDEQPDEAQRQAAIVAITFLLVAGLTQAALVQGLISILAPLGVPVAVVVRLVSIVSFPGLSFTPPPPTAGPAQTTMLRGVVARRAMYFVTASRRMAAGGSPQAETRLFGAHLAAERRREKAAEQIDTASAQFGDILGWKAILDDRTTPLCRAAHGRNFSASRPPEIGWPGIAHGGNCRCRPRAPWPNGSLLP